MAGATYSISIRMRVTDIEREFSTSRGLIARSGWTPDGLETTNRLILPLWGRFLQLRTRLQTLRYPLTPQLSL